MVSDVHDVDSTCALVSRSCFSFDRDAMVEGWRSVVGRVLYEHP
jgi:hypothetical protein